MVLQGPNCTAMPAGRQAILVRTCNTNYLPLLGLKPERTTGQSHSALSSWGRRWVVRWGLSGCLLVLVFCYMVHSSFKDRDWGQTPHAIHLLRRAVPTKDLGILGMLEGYGKDMFIVWSGFFRVPSKGICDMAPRERGIHATNAGLCPSKGGGPTYSRTVSIQVSSYTSVAISQPAGTRRRNNGERLAL